MMALAHHLAQNWGLLAGGSVLGFFVGALTGFFGAGGGFIVTPALNIFLGVDMNLAVGTSSCQVLGASAFSLWRHLDKRLMGIRVAAFMGLGIPLGAWAGALAVKRLKSLPPSEVFGRRLDTVDLTLLAIFTVFLGGVGLWLFYDNCRRSARAEGDEETRAGLAASITLGPMLRFRTIPAGKFSVPVLVAIGLFMGFLGGLLGIGGGFVMLPTLFYVVGQETKYATRTSMMLVLVSGLFSTVFHAADGNINYPLAAFLLLGAFFGTKLGVDLQRRASGAEIRKYFAFVVLGAAALAFFKLASLFFRP